MNPEFWHLAGALVAGSAIGLFYFGGLWLTVTRIPDSRNPHLLLIGSFFMRLAVSLAAFYALVPWGLQAMAVAMAGLMITRQVLTRIKGRIPMTMQ
ncbi:MAG: ATP synthase subunit I [Desulfuromonadales bacterium]|nr:ATP synthase subunit I [Desulfuromonadales bacterium]